MKLRYAFLAVLLGGVLAMICEKNEDGTCAKCFGSILPGLNHVCILPTGEEIAGDLSHWMQHTRKGRGAVGFARYETEHPVAA